MNDVDNENNQSVEELKAKLEKELVALLVHPLVPREFKEVFEGEN